jgi:hypothetical protein
MPLAIVATVRAGWGHHLLSKRRYHFIIPSPDAMIAAASLQTATAATTATTTTTTTTIWSRLLLESPTHLLHGVLHCNGFGHLLRVNGRERGSRYVSGREIMDLWDRICAMLRAR